MCVENVETETANTETCDRVMCVKTAGVLWRLGDRATDEGRELRREDERLRETRATGRARAVGRRLNGVNDYTTL